MTSTAPKTVKFTGARKTETVELPSYQGSQVELYTSLTVEEQQEVTKKWPKPHELNEHEQTEMALFMLTKAIKQWNFTDDDDKPLEFTEANLRRFLIEDLLKMCEIPMGMKLLDENNKPLRAKDLLAEGSGTK